MSPSDMSSFDTKIVEKCVDSYLSGIDLITSNLAGETKSAVEAEVAS